jgi:hypothetical protein
MAIHEIRRELTQHVRERKEIKMNRLIEIPSESGSIIAEVVEPDTEEAIVRASRLSGAVESVKFTFEEALEKVRPAANAIIGKLRSLSDPPDQVSLEFGLKLGAKAGAFIASADSEANFKVALVWRRASEKEKG